MDFFLYLPGGPFWSIRNFPLIQVQSCCLSELRTQEGFPPHRFLSYLIQFFLPFLPRLVCFFWQNEQFRSFFFRVSVFTRRIRHGPVCTTALTFNTLLPLTFFEPTKNGTHSSGEGWVPPPPIRAGSSPTCRGSSIFFMRIAPFLPVRFVLSKEVFIR